ncbi:MAG TPA: polymer-forming cytoskeletal protein [Chthoniobacteraceae bacterium]|nr:polymer-forming cytoskeletal protein [Chthoniobacteraceae bacterium]
MPEIPSNKSNVNNDVEIYGSVTFKGELAFDGKLQGGGITGKVLTVGPAAKIQGDIKSDAVTISGTVTGDVTVAGKCDLKSSAQLFGNLTTARLVMDDGATLIGKAEIKPAGVTLPPTPQKQG